MVAVTARIEPHFNPVGLQDLAVADEQTLSSNAVIAPELQADMHTISPTAFATLAHELYMVGELTWKEYLLVGFPSELHPRFNETIGALTGQSAEPHAPKDMMTYWDEHVAFLRRYQPHAHGTRQADRILSVLVRYNLALPEDAGLGD